MSIERVERRLAAILAADVAGYSRLMGEDEAGTLARLRSHRRELIDPIVAEHKGRIVKTTGDGILIEFPSVVEAVACAVAVQHGMGERNAATPEHQRIVFRVGINLGDVIVEDGDIHGDGVNVAARLEGLAEPGGICVSAMVHDQVRGRLDCAFEDLGEQALKNIARPMRVYRVGPISLLPNPPPLAGEGRMGVTASATGPALPLPDKPSIAVLPFQNMSGDPEQEYFADGMVEEIITALSRIRWLFVIARNSTFTYKGQAVDVKRVGRELGVRYVLEGSVRKGGNRVRITAQLIEAETGTHLWADRFDGSLEDVFDLQDQVAASVAGVIEPALQVAEIQRASQRPTSDLTAYDLYLRALPLFWKLDREGVEHALALLEQAIERDPDYGPALSWAAVCHMQLTVNWAADPERERRTGVERAQRALQNAPNEPIVLANAAMTLASFGQEVATVIPLIDRALNLNPSYGRGWYIRGILKLRRGDPDGAVDDVNASLRLNPRDSFGAPLVILAVADFLGRRFAEAAEKARLTIQQNPGYPHAYRILAACYGHLGQLAEAREAIQQLSVITPNIYATGLFSYKPEHRELFLSGLRLAVGETA